MLLPHISQQQAGTRAALHGLGTTCPSRTRDLPTSMGSCRDPCSEHTPVLRHATYHNLCLQDSEDISGERLKSFRSQQPGMNKPELG